MGARLFVAGLVLTGTAAGGGLELYRINEDPTVVLTPVEAKFLPKEKPILENLASFVCAADVAVENCNEQTMLGSKSAGSHKESFLSTTSPFVIQALRASEDRNFDKHYGADGHAIVRAGWHNVKASLSHLQVEMVEGASTLSSQDARWRYGLRHATSLLEKRHEAEIAMGMEKALEKPCQILLGIPDLPANAEAQSGQTVPVETQNTYPPDVYATIRKCVKDQILTDYTNRVYFGRGAYGIEEGAEQMLGKTAAVLNQSESIFMDAVLRSPSNSDFTSTTTEGLAAEEKTHHERYDVIVNDEYENKDITTKQERDDLINAYAATRAEVIPYVPVGGINTDPAKAIAAEHVVIRAMSDAAGLLGISDEEFSAGSYKVIITIDPAAQAVAANLARLTDNNTEGYQMAMTAMAKSGAVLSMVGGLDRSVSQVNLATGKAGGGSGRNAGSSNKDIVELTALETGHTGLDDDLVHIGLEPNKDGVMKGSYTMQGANNGGPYTVNTGDGCKTLYKHPAPCDMTLGQILEVSSNVGAATLLGEQGSAPAYGATRVYQVMRGLGSDIQGDPVASVVVGSGDVSTYSQALVRRNLYLNQGMSGDAYLVEKIMDSSGAIIYDHSKVVIPPGVQVVDPSIAIKTLQLDRQPVEGVHGTAHAIVAEDGIPANTMAGKTGTAPHNADFWFNGVACDNETGGIAYSVWIGNPKNNTTSLPKGLTSGNAARIAGAYVAGIGAAVDGCQLATQPA